MFNTMFKKLIMPSVVGALLIPALSQAATPTAYLENSQIVAAGRKISAYRVPTRGIDGKIKYYDLSATFNVLDNGSIDTTTSNIVTTLSPNFAANEFVAGTYKTQNGDTTCKVGTTILNGGRMQATLDCIKATYDINISLITGPITEHPFAIELLAAKINEKPAQEDFTWGKVIYSDVTWFGCMNTAEIVSATQIGKTIQLMGYNKTNQQVCGTSLFRQ